MIQPRELGPLPQSWDSLAHAFLQQCRSHPHTLAVADSTGAKLTYEQLLVASVTLANLMAERLNNSACVGVLLPPSTAAAIANLAVVLLGKVPVNLNYTFSQKQFSECIEKTGLHHTISSNSLLKRITLKPEGDLIILEDVKENAAMAVRIRSWLEAELLPHRALAHFFEGLNDHHQFQYDRSSGQIVAVETDSGSRLDDPATVVFTAGSTASPKGVVLSHRNILSNIQAIRTDGHVKPGEIVAGVIPFFHSFGLTMTLWAPLCLGETAVYHYDPFDALSVGKLCEQSGATTLVCTPTMISLYLRRGVPGCFSTVHSFVLGGEKLSLQEFDLISRVFSRAPLEGYGLAETSPVIACNVHGAIKLADGRMTSSTRAGTVGRPVAGTRIRIVDLQHGNEVDCGHEGLIFVNGPQVMLGYLNDVKATKSAINDGWFNTGDIGKLDNDGFLTITGRLSQFSKIAGEMVPHLAVREEIMRIAGLSESDICVTSAADEKRGERLVVLYSRSDVEIDKLISQLKKLSIPRIWIPERRDFIFVEQLPILGNGKLDLKGVKQMSSERTSQCCQ